MRLFEITQPLNELEDPNATLTSILEYLRARALEKGTEPQISVASVVQMVQNAGQNFDAYALRQAVSTQPAIRNLVRSISNDQVILNLDGIEQDDMSVQGKIPPEQKVGMMAQRALSRRQR